MTAAGAQRVADARDGKRPVARHLIHASVELRGHRAGEINCLPDLHQLTGAPKLSHHTRWDAQAGGDALDPGRLGSRVAQAREQTVDPRPHLRVQDDRLVLGQPDPMPAPQQPA